MSAAARWLRAANFLPAFISWSWGEKKTANSAAAGPGIHLLHLPRCSISAAPAAILVSAHSSYKPHYPNPSPTPPCSIYLNLTIPSSKIPARCASHCVVYTAITSISPLPPQPSPLKCGAETVGRKTKTSARHSERQLLFRTSHQPGELSEEVQCACVSVDWVKVGGLGGLGWEVWGGGKIKNKQIREVKGGGERRSFCSQFF